MEVLHVTGEQLGRSQGEVHDGPLTFDLGNLLAWDASAVDAAALTANGTDPTCQRLAQSIFQSLAARLFSLPSEAVAVGRVAELPRPATVLPREKPIPKPRPPTKWEQFAQRKGIEKQKRSKVEWDESSQEWRRRYGYKRVNDETEVAVIEAKAGDLPGEDPFTKQRQDKKERAKKQQKQQLANVKAAVKAGGMAALPPTLRLAAALPEHGKGRPAKRKELHDELKSATKQAAVSTASMGKFDRMARGEKPEDRQVRGKQQKFAPVADKGGVEKQQQAKLVDRILSQNADDVADLSMAITRYEASARDERYRMKQKGHNKKGRVDRIDGSGGGSKPMGGGRSGGNKGRGASSSGGRKGK
ncbi:hypothetical protein D9Q98_010415 [Chlorella vulgaris]|uniref:Ribosome biogenesis regulatory protein n=1 Tax=Chlorella vulgaris TaxID=3077 RepID=A0A9D4TRL6_CHLVU|nr:hypothetical protein D9Q98_010415 [Chlorella vulgaris]